MTKAKNIRSALFIGALLAGAGSASTVIGGTPTSGDLFFTRFTGPPNNVDKVSFSYDGTTATLGATVPLASPAGADGIIFSPIGNLLVGGQGAAVYEITTAGASVGTGTTLGNLS